MINIYSDGCDSVSKLEYVVSLLSPDDLLILVGDGVLNAVNTKGLLNAECDIYVLENDLTARGLSGVKTGKIITIRQMVDLIANDLKSPVSW